MRAPAWIRTAATSGMLLGMLAPPANADRRIPATVFVAKSENRNQVRYSILVDDRCAMTSRAPVQAYWQMLEKGRDVVEPLLDREQAAYGIARQQVAGDSVVVWLRALPARPITIRVTRAPDGRCVSSATATIAGRIARISQVFVALGFLHVDHIVLEGRAEPDGRVVRERVDP